MLSLNIGARDLSSVEIFMAVQLLQENQMHNAFVRLSQSIETRNISESFRLSVERVRSVLLEERMVAWNRRKRVANHKHQQLS